MIRINILSLKLETLKSLMISIYDNPGPQAASARLMPDEFGDLDLISS